MTSAHQISKWFDEGKERQARHMLVLCDTYDWEDYPVYTTTDADCLAKYANPGSMQKVMEVYDLNGDKSSQLGQRRALSLPRGDNGS